MKCVACGNYCSRFNRSTRYFRIPHIDLRIRDAEGRILMEKRQDAWLNALNIKKPKNEQLLRNMRVCSTHFVSGDIFVHLLGSNISSKLGNKTILTCR